MKHYYDGGEKQLLELLKKKRPKDIEEFLVREESWPLQYHLSPKRENILSWFPFEEQAKVLEVGAGCGAVTGVFLKKNCYVTAIESTPERAAVIKERYSRSDNLEILCKSFSECKEEEYFDYVTSIGVLEYAEKMFEPDGVAGFLKNAYRVLKKDGVFIIAIENKYGLKYWSGAKEDHTGKVFDSIEDYPKNSGIYTFGKYEIEEVLQKTGFKGVEFYYPMPDYKMPVEIFSDQYLPSKNHFIKNGTLPAVEYLGSRYHLFNEEFAYHGLIKNASFDFFANSFLIFATK